MTTISDFHLMNLDQRLLKAIADLGWEKPTDIQQAIIPLVFERKSIVVQAKTGSGKTAAFAIPLINEILNGKEFQRVQTVNSLIIAPTKELCNQAYKNVQNLCKYSSNNISCIDLSQYNNPEVLKPLLADAPDIVIGTPAKLLAHTRSQHLLLDKLKHVVIDEADLIFTFGYQADMKELKNFLPKSPLQVTLLSATLDDSTKVLRKCLVKGGEWVRVELPDEAFLPSASLLTQYIIRAEEVDKFVILVSLLKLKLVRGKTIIFANSVDRCYKLRLFLEEFGIRSALLNAELPVSSRCHAVDQFNRGIYDYMIATDEASTQTEDVAEKSKRDVGRSHDVEFGVARGIDFKLVSNVINFDMPHLPAFYVHRVGRTARAGQPGTALSLVSDAELPLLQRIEQLLAGKTPANATTNDDNADKESADAIAASSSVFKSYQFRMSEVDGFRYRALDVMRKFTRSLIRDARLKEIKTELINSERLRGYFEDHAPDLDALRHDRPLNHTVASHLRDVPEYLVPPSLRAMMPGKSMTIHQRKRWTEQTFVVNSGKVNKPLTSAAATRKPKKSFKPNQKRKTNNPLFTFGKKEPKRS